MALECLVSISCPGSVHSLHDNVHISAWLRLLDERNINYTITDRVAGWGCLNQDWIEFYCDVETSWDWCYLTFIRSADWEHSWYPLFKQGQLLMQIHYRDGDKLVSHH